MFSHKPLLLEEGDQHSQRGFVQFYAAPLPASGRGVTGDGRCESVINPLCRLDSLEKSELEMQIQHRNRNEEAFLAESRAEDDPDSLRTSFSALVMALERANSRVEIDETAEALGGAILDGARATVSLMDRSWIEVGAPPALLGALQRAEDEASPGAAWCVRSLAALVHRDGVALCAAISEEVLIDELITFAESDHAEERARTEALAALSSLERIRGEQASSNAAKQALTATGLYEADMDELTTAFLEVAQVELDRLRGMQGDVELTGSAHANIEADLLTVEHTIARMKGRLSVAEGCVADGSMATGAPLLFAGGVEDAHAAAAQTLELIGNVAARLGQPGTRGTDRVGGAAAAQAGAKNRAGGQRPGASDGDDDDPDALVKQIRSARERLRHASVGCATQAARAAALQESAASAELERVLRLLRGGNAWSSALKRRLHRLRERRASALGSNAAADAAAAALSGVTYDTKNLRRQSQACAQP
mmetsp:Transcript_23041/g.75109  ORF Transcript_23041/g.75109 Transcript_23041/m.75109 type:complete len:482 (-) Transcript_23041:29-1474(-)